MADEPSPALRICAAVRRVVGWDRVAVVAADGLEHRLPLSGSDAVLQHFGDLQQSLVEGPGADVLVTGIPLLVDDLRVPVERWTLLMASVPQGFPVRSLAVVPLFSGRGRHLGSGDHPRHPSSAEGTGATPTLPDAVRDAAVVSGVLIAARDSVEPFTDAEVLLLESLAALVVVVADHRIASGGSSTPALSSTPCSPGAETTGGAGGGSITLPGEEVAVVVGMLRERLGSPESQAVAVLRAHAFGAGVTIHEAARAVLAGRTGLDDLMAPP